MFYCYHCQHAARLSPWLNMAKPQAGYIAFTWHDISCWMFLFPTYTKTPCSCSFMWSTCHGQQALLWVYIRYKCWYRWKHFNIQKQIQLVHMKINTCYDTNHPSAHNQLTPSPVTNHWHIRIWSHETPNRFFDISANNYVDTSFQDFVMQIVEDIFQHLNIASPDIHVDDYESSQHLYNLLHIAISKLHPSKFHSSISNSITCHDILQHIMEHVPTDATANTHHPYSSHISLIEACSLVPMHLSPFWLSPPWPS